MNTELELKFGLPDAAVSSLREALLARGARSVHLQAVYFDTPAGDLAAQRIALRLRREGRAWVQTLKVGGEGSLQRWEHEAPVRGARGAAPPALDLQRHAGSPAWARLQAALPELDAGDLLPQLGTDVQRLQLRVDVSGSTIEIALDTGHVSAGERRQPLVELELEWKSGPHAGLFDLAAAWVQHGGLWLSSLSKAERAERLARGIETGPPQRWLALAMPASPDAATLMRSLLQSALLQVLRNASEVAAGNPDADVLHQLRVGLRRLRTLLSELQALLSDATPVAAWTEALRITFGLLGQVRDQQAVVEAVRPLLEAAGKAVPAWPAVAASVPAQTVRDSGFQKVLIELLALAHAGDEAFVALDPASTRALLADRLDGLQRRLARDAGRFEKLPVERQHRARKRLKRLRYLLDFTLPLWRRKRTRQFAQRLSRAQDALGLHNDVVVASETFRAHALDDPAAADAAQWLQAHSARTAAKAARQLERLTRRSPPWDS